MDQFDVQTGRPAGRFAELIAGARQQAERIATDSARGHRLAAARAALSDVGAIFTSTQRETAALPAELLERYTITHEVHRGGQGVVYAAIQKSTGRRVAIKVMLQGPFARREDALRFEREVQILGQLDHTNIVGIIDSGVSRGLFYFVMEFVEGESLGDWLSRRLESSAPPASRSTVSPANTFDHPSTVTKQQVDDVLRLFVKICTAVHAAHLRGVIHRDLKPGNIQIDPAGEPHVLDFGLAKLDPIHAGGSSAAAGMTQAGQFFGSLPWASPEQASGRLAAIDVRSDVYALGVILYQLLTNCFPYRVEGSTAETLHNIQQAEPIRLRALNASLDDELETISLKCLQKDPDRRYQSAGELAEDIRRYTSGEPIAAKRDALSYLIRKQLRRHRATIGVAAAFLILLTGGGITSLVLWRQAATQRDHAQAAERVADTRRAEAETVTHLLESLLASADPLETKGPDYRVVQLLDDFDGSLGDKLRDQPQVAAHVHSLMGRAYRELSQFEKSEGHLRAALDLNVKTSGERSDSSIWSLIDLGHLFRSNGHFKDAENSYQQALDFAVAAHGESSSIAIEALRAVGDARIRAGEFAKAEPPTRRALELARELGDLDRLASCLHTLGMLLDDQLDPAALDTYRQAIDVDSRLYGPRHPNVATDMLDLAQAESLFDQLDSAEGHMREAIAILTESYGPQDVKVVGAGEILGQVLSKRGQLAEAEELTRQSLKVRRRMLGKSDPHVASSLNNLGAILHALKRDEEAKQALEESVAIYRKKPWLSRLDMTRALNNLAKSEFDLGDIDSAAEHMREALQLDQAALRPDHPAIIEDWRGVSWVLQKKEDWEGALNAQRQAVSILSQTPDYERAILRRDQVRLADLLGTVGIRRTAKDEVASAERAFRECLEMRRKLLNNDDWRIGSACSLLGEALRRQGNAAEARPLIDEAWTRLRQNKNAPLSTLQDIARRTAEFWDEQGDADKAVQVRADSSALERATSRPAS